MDEVDFLHELGANMRGNEVYPTVEDLKIAHSCVRECGIVEVEIRFIREVQPPDYSDLINAAEDVEEENKEKSTKS